ncbi:MAG: sugar-binding protein [Granulosicoccus sp.]
MNKISLSLLAGITSVVYAGCDPGLGKQSLVNRPDSTSRMSLSTPDFLQRVRAIDSDNLFVVATVNGTKVGMLREGNDWIGTVLIPPGEVASIELVWSEKLPDSAEALELAIYRHTTNPITSNTLLPLSEDDYDTTAFDFDEDGISNYAERRDDSDPLNGSDSGDSPTPNPDDDNLDIAADITGTPDVDVIINRIDLSDSPLIDGNYDDIWNTGDNWSDVIGNLLHIDNLILGADNSRQPEEDFEFQWVAMHDGIYLYLLAIGEQAEGSTQFADSVQMWHDDSIELFLDGDNSKNTSYDGVNDYHFLIPHLKLKQPFEANSIYDADHRKQVGPDSAPWPANMEFVNYISQTHRHSWEFRINLSQVGIEIGQPFGIDLQYSDDQDGGDRDAKWSWMSADDNTWHNPSLMGTAILED